MKKHETTPDWLKRKHPELWIKAEKLVASLPDIPKARWRWEMLRRWPAFVADCKALHEFRKDALKHTVAGYRNQSDKDRLTDDFSGTPLHKKGVEALCLKWGLTAPHPDGNLLFIDPGVEFEMLLKSMVVVLLLLHRNSNKIMQWLEDFSSCDGDTFFGFHKIRLIGPNFLHDNKGETTIYSHIEVSFEKLSTQQAEDMINAVGRDDNVFCFDCKIIRLDDDYRKVVFRVAAPSCPILGVMDDAWERAAPIMQRINAIVIEVLGVQLPSAVVVNENRTEAVEKQIMALAGQTKESRPLGQARRKMRPVQVAAQEREKIVTKVKS